MKIFNATSPLLKRYLFPHGAPLLTREVIKSGISKNRNSPKGREIIEIEMNAILFSCVK